MARNFYALLWQFSALKLRFKAYKKACLIGLTDYMPPVIEWLQNAFRGRPGGWIEWENSILKR
jgi:hypothetical protein